MLGSVKLSREEKFYYYYDLNISSENMAAFQQQLEEGKNGVQIFSYAIQDIEPTALLSNYNQFHNLVLGIDGDVVISSKQIDAKQEGYKSTQVNAIIDAYNIYDFDTLVSDAKAYLSNYLAQSGDPLEFSNLDKDKIEQTFLARVKKDNRFRTKAQKSEGVLLELARIEDLCNATKRLSLLLDYDNSCSSDDKIFYSYRCYEQSYNLASEEEKVELEEIYNNSKTLRYGLNMGKLINGDLKTSDYFKILGSEDAGAKDVVIIGFNFYNKQPNYQFELITFYDYIISTFGNISFYA